MSLEESARALFDCGVDVVLKESTSRPPGTLATLRCSEVTFEYMETNTVYSGSIEKDEFGFMITYFEPEFSQEELKGDWGLTTTSYAIRASFGDVDIQEITDIQFDSQLLQIFYFIFAPTHIVYDDTSRYVVSRTLPKQTLWRNLRPYLRNVLDELTHYDNAYLVAFETSPTILFTESKDPDAIAQHVLEVLDQYNLYVEDTDGVIGFGLREVECEVRFLQQDIDFYLDHQLVDIEMCHWKLGSQHAILFHKQEELFENNRNVTVSTYSPTPLALESLANLFAFQQWALKHEMRDSELVIDNTKKMEEIFYVLFATTHLSNILQWNTNVSKLGNRIRSMPKYLFVVDDVPEMRYLKFTIDYTNTPRIYNTSTPVTELFFAHPVWTYKGDDLKSTTTGDNVSLQWMRPSTAPDYSAYMSHLPSNCFDIANIDETKLEAFVQESKDSLVFILDGHADIATCILRQNFQMSYSVFYPCLKPNNAQDGLSVQYDTPIIRMMIHTFPIHITQPNFSYLQKQIEDGQQVFSVQLLPEIVPYTISQEARSRIEGSFISADHCQAGTQKQMYVVVPLQFASASPHTRGFQLSK